MTAIAHWFYRLLIANPMIVRIVQGASRRQRDLWVRMTYLGVLILLVLIGLLSAGGGLTGAATMTDLAKAGALVFQIIAYGQVILVCLLAPLFMASAIAAEQAGRTLNILLTTPLSNLQVVLGSLLGRLFFVLALLASGLPLFAVLLVFGGVPIRSVFVSFAVAGLTALFVGAVAVLLSTLRAGGRKAVFTFVISIAAYLILAYALDTLLLRRLDPGHTTWLTPLHPLLVLESNLDTANYAPPVPGSLTDQPWAVRVFRGQPFGAFAAITGTASLLMVLFSAVMLRQIGTGGGRLTQWLKAKLRLGQGAIRGRRRKVRRVGKNPIAWREANTRGKVASGILARWAFAFFGLLLGAGLLAAYHFEKLPAIPSQTGGALPPAELFKSALLVMLLLEIAVIGMVAIYMSAGSVSKEREDGTLDIMLTTPITPKYYIWGKLRGLVGFLGLLIAVPVLTVAMVSVYSLAGRLAGGDFAERATVQASVMTNTGAALSDRVPLMLEEAWLLLAAMLVPFVALCVATGMNWSLKAKGVLGAVVPTLAVIGVLAVVLGLCGWQAAANVPFVGPILNAFSPATNVMMVLNPYEMPWFMRQPAAGRASLAFAAACAAGGYSLIVWAIILNMVRGFDQTVRKLSGTG